MAEVDPGAVLEDAIAATGGLFRDARSALDADVAPADRLVYADRDRLMQVFINLLSNAAKFADPDEGRSWIRCARYIAQRSPWALRA